MGKNRYIRNILFPNYSKLGCKELQTRVCKELQNFQRTTQKSKNTVMGINRATHIATIFCKNTVGKSFLPQNMELLSKVFCPNTLQYNPVPVAYFLRDGK